MEKYVVKARKKEYNCSSRPFVHNELDSTHSRSTYRARAVVPARLLCIYGLRIQHRRALHTLCAHSHAPYKNLKVMHVLIALIRDRCSASRRPSRACQNAATKDRKRFMRQNA